MYTSGSQPWVIFPLGGTFGGLENFLVVTAHLTGGGYWPSNGQRARSAAQQFCGAWDSPQRK